MWKQVTEEISLPCKAVEDIHWPVGKEDMARRAGIMPFSTAEALIRGWQHYVNILQLSGKPIVLEVASTLAW
jgi:hypothetical protein